MTEASCGTAWFAAQLRPNSHNIAVRNLMRQGFHSFLPLEEVTRRTASKFTTRLRPLFPGYVFVSMDIQMGSWRAVNSTFGITKLVSHCGAPARIPFALISQLMLRCDETGKLLPPKEFKPGDQVTLTRGPFSDFVAKIESISPDRRIWIMLELLGAERRVAVSEEHLRAI